VIPRLPVSSSTSVRIGGLREAVAAVSAATIAAMAGSGPVAMITVVVGMIAAESHTVNATSL
jgi:hypothetical protein